MYTYIIEEGIQAQSKQKYLHKISKLKLIFTNLAKDQNVIIKPELFQNHMKILPSYQFQVTTD